MSSSTDDAYLSLIDKAWNAKCEAAIAKAAMGSLGAVMSMPRAYCPQARSSIECCLPKLRRILQARPLIELFFATGVPLSQLAVLVASPPGTEKEFSNLYEIDKACRKLLAASDDKFRSLVTVPPALSGTLAMLSTPYWVFLKIKNVSREETMKKASVSLLGVWCHQHKEDAKHINDDLKDDDVLCALAMVLDELRTPEPISGQANREVWESAAGYLFEKESDLERMRVLMAPGYCADDNYATALSIVASGLAKKPTGESSNGVEEEEDYTETSDSEDPPTSDFYVYKALENVAQSYDPFAR